MQNQTFSAILFLYQQVLEIELDRVEFLRAQRPERLSAVLAVEEVRRIHAVLDGVPRLVGELLYGGGLGVMEVAMWFAVAHNVACGARRATAM